MGIMGIILCIISIFLLYKRLVYLFLGKCVKGIIIGYGMPIKGYKGVESYPYKVKYQYDNKEYIGYSLENVTTSYSNFPNKNLQREVTIYFRKEKPEVITIKEFNHTFMVGMIFFLFGILGIVLSFKL